MTDAAPARVAGPFPVTRSVLSAPALAARLLPAYALGPDPACDLLHHGLNDLYRVEDRDAHPNRYVLRVLQSRGRDPDDVAYEVALLDHLAARGVPVARPIPRRDGAFVTVLEAPEGPRPAVLFAWAPGVPLHATDHDEVTAEAYGGAAAGLHAATDGFAPPGARFRLDHAFLVDAPLAAVRPLLVHRPEDRAWLDRLADLLVARIAALPATGLDVGPCHGDLSGANAAIADDGTLTFFDFENCGLGFRASDLATFRWGVAMGAHRMGVDDEALWSAFLRGYAGRRPIPRRDRAAVPLFVAARHCWYLGLQAANRDHWGLAEADDAFFDAELAFLRDWIDRFLPDAR